MNNDYWARRNKILNDAILDEAYKDVENLEREYTKAIKEIDAKIRSWYQRLADNNGVSFAEAKKLLKADELKEFHWTVEEYIQKGMSGKWQTELENASARVHISRLESLRIQLQQHAEELTGKRIEVTRDAAGYSYQESYYHTAYEMQKVAGVGVPMQKVDTDRLEKVLSRPWTADGLTFSDRIWTDNANLVSKINKELTRMVATGAAPDQAIKNIAAAFNTSKANAGRVVMTESAFFASKAHKDCFEELDVDRYQVRSALDGHVCDECGDEDTHTSEEPYKMSEYEIGVTAPPFHPWCRCTTVPYYEDMKGIGERWMRDPETGEGGYVPSDMSYQEWKEIYVDKTSTMDEWNKKHGLVSEAKDTAEFVNPYTGEIVEIKKPVQYGYRDNIIDKCGADFERGFAEKVEQADDTVKALFYKGSKDIYVVDGMNHGGAYYDTMKRGISFRSTEDMYGRGSFQPYQVSFHEFGHNLDYANGIHHTEGLYETIKKESKELEKKLYAAAGYPGQKDPDFFRLTHGARVYFGEDIPKGALNGVSDILEPFSKGSKSLGAGHGKSYWGTEKSGEKQENVITEFMAHFCESAVAVPEYGEAMRKAFPKSWEALEKAIWEAIT